MMFRWSSQKKELSIVKLWLSIKELPELNKYFPDLKENILSEIKYTCAIISTLKRDVVKSLLSEARLRRSINSKEKLDSLIKVSQEYYDAISAVVCQKCKYNIFVALKYVAHRDVALFLLRKNKVSKTREAAKKYSSKLSFLENSYRKRTEKEKNVSMKSPSKYYNKIEMEDEDPDPSLQWVRKHTTGLMNKDSKI